ncbi:hypothetical protein EDD86DRAFT_246635 [Gorgonomyces haynaldii]|nr:hypothetical protein EDD86DRAFT_246635 [Gorgonomyces haynaldii]
MLRKPIQADSLTSAILTCKRLQPLLQEWDSDSVYYDTAHKKAKADINALTDIWIPDCLTRVSMTTEVSLAHLGTLKRLHLAPEQLRRQFIALVETKDPTSLKRVGVVLNGVLRDLLALQQANNEFDTLPRSSSVEIKKPSLPKKRSSRESLPEKMDAQSEKTIHEVQQVIQKPPENCTIFIKCDQKTVKRVWDRIQGLRELKRICMSTFRVDGEIFIYDQEFQQHFIAEHECDVINGSLIEYRSLEAKESEKSMDKLHQKLDVLLQSMKESDQSTEKTLLEKPVVEKQATVPQKRLLSKYKFVTKRCREETEQMRLEIQKIKDMVKQWQVNTKNIIEPLERLKDTESVIENKMKRVNARVLDLQKQAIHFESLLEVSRLDLQRGVKPPPHLRELLVDEHKRLERELSEWKKEMQEHKSVLKSQWQLQLNRLLKDQEQLGQRESLTEDLIEGLRECVEDIKNLTEILDQQQDKPKIQPMLQVLDAHEAKAFGMKRVLGELVETYEERNVLQVLDQFEHIRSKQKAEYNEFTQVEWIAAVAGH